MPEVWAVVPAAGRGRRFGGPRPKQYLEINGRPVLAHALDALLAHDAVRGAMVAIAPDDADWPGWTERRGKPVHTCVGGAERADSVLAGLRALDGIAPQDAWALVHDAARPNLALADLDRLLAVAFAQGDGAILAAPVRDTLKRANAAGGIAATQPREQLWRALTPQLFRRDALAAALAAAAGDGIVVTDEAMAMERAGAQVRLVEGREDNLKVTTPADLALVEFLLARRDADASYANATGATA
ncbi:2-C-methyl-D-erythritol 4-phosphate cytidylyltransferase [Cognatilysobacter bugurensis]|uniref:2-C-methyl-D-erythritol 4-phosphate cytidylyltransferase n=1 Tax=Cognatilysobacter bugurensis TaxID=543356 RepID=A0A918W3J0_9GAMM|nr:2-C-methyl-D-erythritol 4-phosphate cytidylyltransferase [Lysobacter bugurensis]